MKSKEIYLILNKKLKLKKIYVDGNNGNFNIIAIDDIFEKLSYVKQQKIIYEPLSEYIFKKIIHSLIIKTYSLKEWKNKINKYNK
ncbi:BolA/IbaG family iron-sulfur metabolism protein [Candidatus Annandia adelgestsuga]|uniref:BolA/IbaG family iron-sulfur metabolism protein n=1 Tax=Candidatus Annandia adelgestsuga TaxID=1302411 RepID=UPI000F7F8181|nr:BolA/IbaG family iron-sulfur metabolism protein [Candidatus Annandia adelgestsuga]